MSMSQPTDWRILIVEDEPDGQEVVVALLGEFDIAADVVGTAEEALDRLAQRNYTAAIIDLALPHMDGLELLKTIRSNPVTVSLPCIAYTAYHSSLVKKQAIEAGCNAYLSKPLDDTYFVKELSRVIDSA
jgi:two-component system, cell cycle response regulator DivK